MYTSANSAQGPHTPKACTQKHKALLLLLLLLAQVQQESKGGVLASRDT
jgi:hypothetical protein